MRGHLKPFADRALPVVYVLPWLEHLEDQMHREADDTTKAGSVARWKARARIAHVAGVRESMRHLVQGDVGAGRVIGALAAGGLSVEELLTFTEREGPCRLLRWERVWAPLLAHLGRGRPL